MFFHFPLLRALTASHMLPTLCVIDKWQLLAVFLCLHPHAGNFFTLTPLAYFFLLSFLSPTQVFGYILIPQRSKNHKPKAAGAEHSCSHKNHPFEIKNLSHLGYLQDVISEPPTDLIPDRNTVDVATRILPLQLHPVKQIPGVPLSCQAAKKPKKKTSYSHYNYLHFLRILMSTSVLQKNIISCIFAPKSLLPLDEDSRYDVIWMWESNFLVAGKHLRFVLCHMIQPSTTLSSAQETGKNRAKLFSFNFFPLNNLQGQNEKLRQRHFGEAEREAEDLLPIVTDLWQDCKYNPNLVGSILPLGIFQVLPVSPWGVMQAPATDNANLTCPYKSNSLFS